MLNSLYEEAIRKKGLIDEPLEEYVEAKIDIESKWHEEEISSPDSNLILAAGDGSYNKKKYLSFNFYALSAESLIYNPKDIDSKLKTIESVELDIIPHQSFIEDRLRNMMSIFEIKTAIKTFNDYKVDYYMDDGSILGDLIRPIPVEKAISQEYKEDIISKVKEKLEREIQSNELNLSSYKFKNEFKELFEDENIDEYALISFLESLENLIALKYLLENRKKIIAISKTSSSNEIFHANIPDMAILDRFTKKQGYSEYYRRKVTYKTKHDFPIENEFFRELSFTIFFARLEDNKNIIKIELPYHAEEEDIKEVLRVIKSNSTEGYPFLLKKAHKDVVISNQNMNSLSKIIGFLDKSGREILD
ncbi:DNA double-strand break repair nuclease NurA [Methanobrevibacter olleyae]|uniref:NurA 5'-3' nuclease n=1 Tax=Methanobrevibacter olleyae TaxID=294671 RepID=A0A126QZ42_METOL|nr:DNA double-strand break repair nuclease NurA [Methanobrevibacter olleyae]AMK15321.1 NurA domain-containing protein [Methanobrevibacter olleyae]SFL29948.1 NurA 5'-3' nuclease [Methanobrevibacter olleyae]